jgi:hypothetical protein
MKKCQFLCNFMSPFSRKQVYGSESVGICVEICGCKFCIRKPYIKHTYALSVSLGRFAPLALKRVGLGTNLRSSGFRRQRTRSEQLKEDTKSAYVRRFLRGDVINFALLKTRTQFTGTSKLAGDQQAKGSPVKRGIRVLVTHIPHPFGTS